MVRTPRTVIKTKSPLLVLLILINFSLQADQNKLVMAGALTDPVDGAIFIFRNVSKEDIEAFVQADPYVQNGLVPGYEIRPYMVVAGDRD